MGSALGPAARDVNFAAPLLARASKEQLMAEIESLEPPTFFPPYPSRQNIHHAKCKADSVAWLNEHNAGSLFESDQEKWQRFLRQNLSDAMAWVYPDAAEDRLVWIGCYCWWLFLVDDLLDGVGHFCTPEKSTSFYVEVNLTMMSSFPDNTLLHSTFVELVNCFPEEQRHAILENVDAELIKARQSPGPVYDTSCSPAITSFKDLWVKLLASTPQESVIRWGVSLQRYLLGNIYEAENRINGAVPSIAEYIAIRRNTSAMYPCMWIVDFSESFERCLPQEVFDSPEMKELQEAINDIVAWHNDIYSVKKELSRKLTGVLMQELLEGEVHNLVTVVSHERGCSFSEAMVIALGMLMDRLQDLDRAIVDLEGISTPENREMIAAYVKTSQFWVTGTHDFTVVRSGRYLWDMSASQWWLESSPKTTLKSD